MDVPPPVLGCDYVAAFAHIDESVRFVQRRTLNAGGVWLGRVPCIALCQDFETSEVSVQHCNEHWEVLGVAGRFRSLSEAKERIERSYPGIGARPLHTRAGLGHSRG